MHLAGKLTLFGSAAPVPGTETGARPLRERLLVKRRLRGDLSAAFQHLKEGLQEIGGASLYQGV